MRTLTHHLKSLFPKELTFTCRSVIGPLPCRQTGKGVVSCQRVALLTAEAAGGGEGEGGQGVDTAHVAQGGRGEDGTPHHCGGSGQGTSI